MNSRLVEMIARGRLPFRGGQWIDTYNQITDPDCAGTIIAGINAKNHYYVMEEMKEFILDLSLKWEWYDMIERGEKTEEYREMKDYYLKRLVYRDPDHPRLEMKYIKKSDMLLFARAYSAVRFHRGQGGRQTMLFEYKGFTIGFGNPLWGAPKDKEVFIIKIGKRLDITEPQVLTPKRTEYGKQVRKDYEEHKIYEHRKNIQQLEPRKDGVTNTLTGVQKDNYVVIPANTADSEIRMEMGGVCDLSYPNSKTRRGRVQDGGSVTPALTTHTEHCLRRIEPINDQDGCGRTIKRQYQQTSRANLERQDALGATGATDGFRIRKLTPRECFRLMGVSDADIDKIQAAGISKSQQYKMAGNSIVVNCLSAIFRQLYIGNFNKVIQTEIF